MDIWTIIAYVLGILFNIGIVAAFRSKAIDKGREFLSSGRFAVVAVFLLCFVELLITGRFEALQNATAFLELIQQAATMTMATVGTHTAGKTITR